MLFKNENISPGLKTSPWIILGATTILLVVVLALAIQNTRREKRYMNQVLSAKGAALIRAVEAGTRTGMMGMKWGGRQVQRLLQETARLPNVRYLAVIQIDGRVMAHSDVTRVGQPFRTGRQVIHLGPELQENRELVTLDNGQRVFEVHRHFRPLVHHRRSHGDHKGAMMRRHSGQSAGDKKDWLDTSQDQPLLIVVGQDVTPFETAIQEDLRNTALLSILLLLLGFAGFVSLFWMQSYRVAHRFLKDTSAFADEVVANLPVGLIATDDQGRIVFFNAAAEMISGVPQAVALGREPDEVLPRNLCELKTALQRGQTITEREMACDFSGASPVPVSVSATTIVNDLDHLVGNVLILRDLGEVHRLQGEIRRQEKLVAVGGMAAGVAHEIRNPLSSIKGMATYLAGKFSQGSEDRNAAQVMVQEVDRLNRVITELLEFARPTDISPRPTDLEQLLQHSLQLIQQDAAAQKIEIRLVMEAGLRPALIDPDRFSQCLLNLFLNAIQAMVEGGELTVRCHSAESDHLKLEICDTGKGIPSDALSKVFNPYFTTKSKGAGLGLALVHKIVEAHQGRITAQNNSERGTTFSLWLPCDSIERKNHAGQSSKQNSGG